MCQEVVFLEALLKNCQKKNKKTHKKHPLIIPVNHIKFYVPPVGHDVHS